MVPFGKLVCVTFRLQEERYRWTKENHARIREVNNKSALPRLVTVCQQSSCLQVESLKLWGKGVQGKRNVSCLELKGSPVSRAGLLETGSRSRWVKDGQRCSWVFRKRLKRQETTWNGHWEGEGEAEEDEVLSVQEWRNFKLKAVTWHC